MIRQRTLKNVIKATGVGLHTGRQIHLSLRPAPIDSGIVFRRVDLAEPVTIRACVAAAGSTAGTTSLREGTDEIAAVAHLLAACAGLGLDNAYIDVDASELPIMDGSAAPFVFLLQSAGMVEQAAPKRYLWIRKRVRVSTAGGQWAQLEPGDSFSMAFQSGSDSAADGAGRPTLSLDFASASFSREIGRARHLDSLRTDSRLTGGSLNNTVILDRARTLDEGGLRYADELSRHHLLDALGDLSLLSYRLKGAFSACQSDHTLHHRLLRALLADEAAWEVLASGVADSELSPAAGRLARAG